MDKNKNFYITYYAKKYGGVITRKAKWTDDCKTWLSKLNNPCMTYYDLEKHGYKTATGKVDIKYDS